VDNEPKIDFYKRVALVCRRIPKGTTATYGQIALLCGYPKNSRQVGYALGHHLAEDAPAHRVVNTKGILSGADSFETPSRQRELLEKEGVAVTWTDQGYRVDLKTYGWKNTLRDALWIRNEFEARNI